MGGYSWGRHCTGFLIFPIGERGCFREGLRVVARARGSLAIAKRLLHGPCGADKLGISQHDWVTLRYGLVCFGLMGLEQRLVF